eukprot:1145033-Pelagomonas_calceolata.AAC.5
MVFYMVFNMVLPEVCCGPCTNMRCPTWCSTWCCQKSAVDPVQTCGVLRGVLCGVARSLLSPCATTLCSGGTGRPYWRLFQAGFASASKMIMCPWTWATAVKATNLGSPTNLSLFSIFG